MTYGIEEYGIQETLTFKTNTKPTKENIEKFIKLLEKSKEEKSLEEYFSCIKFIKAEIIVEE